MNEGLLGVPGLSDEEHRTTKLDQNGLGVEEQVRGAQMSANEIPGVSSVIPCVMRSDISAVSDKERLRSRGTYRGQSRRGW